MPIKKTNAALEALKAEAEAEGITLAQADDGTFSASVVGGITLIGMTTPQAALDDIRAVIAMDKQSEIYRYDDDGLGGYRVSVIGGDHFDAPSMAQAFALAQESVIAAEPPAEKPAGKRSRIKREVPDMPEPDELENVMSAPLEPTETPEDVRPKLEPRGNGSEESEQGTVTVSSGLPETPAVPPADIVAEALLAVARALVEQASTLRSGSAVPSIHAFEEPPPAQSRVARETKFRKEQAAKGRK